MSVTAPTHHIHSFNSFIHFIHCIHSCLPRLLAIQDLPAEVAPAEETPPLAPQPQPQAGAAILPAETGFARLRVIENQSTCMDKLQEHHQVGPLTGYRKATQASTSVIPTRKADAECDRARVGPSV